MDTGPRSRRTAAIAAALAAGALAIGCSFNPGYFPYYAPGGFIAQMHAKPSGPGYFKDFDPKACRLEVNPPQATSPPGSAVVLVATVYDKDGQPRRDRRVEWIVEGPGNVVEVDESGLYAGRGYKVDNKYAVSYTNYTSHCITRGNDDPRDDVNLAPGQTFCVVSSAVPGETTVTALAPGVFNWDSGRVQVKVLWADGRFGFPPPAVVRYGGEATLSTKIDSASKAGEPVAYRIRYRVLDGPAAALVSRAGSGTGASLSGTSAKEAEAFADANGEAAVRLVQTTPLAGKTRVAVEVVKPAENGVGPGTVVTRRETVVEWAAPNVELDVIAPPTAGLNATLPVTATLTNLGLVAGSGGKVRVALPAGATLLKVDPPPAAQDATSVTWAFAESAPGSRQEMTLQLRPTQPGPLALAATAQTADGLKAERQVTVQVGLAKLQALLEAPPRTLAGDTATVRLSITNPGAAPAANVTAWVRADDGLKHASGKNPAEVAVGAVAAGQTKTVEVPFAAPRGGRFSVRANATADGGVGAAADAVTVAVDRAELKLAVTGPDRAYLGQEMTWTATVRNPGDTAIVNGLVRGTLPPELKGRTANEGGRLNGPTVEWPVSELRPGEERKLTLTCAVAAIADRATFRVVATGDAAGATGPPSKGAGDPVEAKAEGTVAVIGTPTLVLEHSIPPGPLEVGGRLRVTVRVKNRGTISARGVQITLLVPVEVKALRGSGAAEGRLEAGQIAFPALEELKPNDTATFAVDLEGVSAGSARVLAEVRALHLAKPLKEEQAIQVVGSR